MINSPLDTLHIPIIVDKDPDAKYSPSGENTTLLNKLLELSKILIYSQLDILHNLIVVFPNPEAKYSPFGENTTLKTLV